MAYDINKVVSDIEIYTKWISEFQNMRGKRISEILTHLKLICPQLYQKYEKDEGKYRNKYGNKGSIGNFVERFFFGLEKSSLSSPDIPELGVEIKTTTFKQLKNSSFNAKERLTITNVGKKNDMSTFSEITNNTQLVDTSYFKKMQNITLFVFKPPTKKPNQNIFDWILNHVLIYCIHLNFHALLPKYKTQIQSDYEIIKRKISEGCISQKGQTYLHIHSHGNKGSKTCALGYKPKFITMLIGDDIYQNTGKYPFYQSINPKIRNRSISIYHEYIYILPHITINED